MLSAANIKIISGVPKPIPKRAILHSPAKSKAQALKKVLAPKTRPRLEEEDKT